MGRRPRECPPPPGLSYLDVVVLGASHHQVVLAGGLGDRQPHHGADVAGQLGHGLEPVLGEARAGAGGQGPWAGGRGRSAPARTAWPESWPPHSESSSPGHGGQGTETPPQPCRPGGHPSGDLRTPGHAPTPARPGSHLLSSQTRTALPEAAYSMAPDGLRAIWLICCSPCVPVRARVDVEAQASPEVTWPEDLPVRERPRWVIKAARAHRPGTQAQRPRAGLRPAPPGSPP